MQKQMKHNYFDTFYLKICSQVEQSAPGFVPLLAPVLEVLAVPGFEAAVPGLAPSRLSGFAASSPPAGPASPGKPPTSLLAAAIAGLFAPREP